MTVVATPEIELVCKLVDDLTGIQWDADKSYLIESRLKRLVTEHACQDLTELVSRIRTGDEQLKETVIDAVTTRETLFFRDDAPFAALRNKALPEIIDAKSRHPGAQRLRIWSAACSSGQEPYSLGITLLELLDDVSDWDIVISASDLSASAIESAQTGIYSDFEMSRGVSPQIKQKYFEQVPGGLRICNRVRKMVTFHQRNLLEPFGAIGPFDIIFCRNVAIYFDGPTKDDLFERLAGVLAPHGAIFVGGSESLSAMGDRWKPQQHCRGVFYQPNRKDIPEPAIVTSTRMLTGSTAALGSRPGSAAPAPRVSQVSLRPAQASGVSSPPRPLSTRSAAPGPIAITPRASVRNDSTQSKPATPKLPLTTPDKPLAQRAAVPARPAANTALTAALKTRVTSVAAQAATRDPRVIRPATTVSAERKTLTAPPAPKGLTTSSALPTGHVNQTRLVTTKPLPTPAKGPLTQAPAKGLFAKGLMTHSQPTRPFSAGVPSAQTPTPGAKVPGTPLPGAKVSGGNGLSGAKVGSPGIAALSLSGLQKSTSLPKPVLPRNAVAGPKFSVSTERPGIAQNSGTSVPGKSPVTTKARST